MSSSRLRHLLDQKPQELKDYALDRIADELARELRAFPPPIEEWLENRVHERYRPALERTSPPDLEVYRVGCGLAFAEMKRDYEGIDRYVRSPELLSLLPDPVDRLCASFITQFLVDSALSLQEHAPGKFKRADLATLMEKVEERLLKGYRLRL